MRRALGLLILCGSASAVAHDSPEHTAERLDELLLAAPAASVLIERAEVHRELGEFQGAHRLLQQAAVLEPRNPSVWLAHAENYAQFDQHDATILAATEYLQLAGPSLRGLWLRADARAETGQLDPAHRDCLALSDLNANVEVALLCAHVASLCGDGAGAFETLERGYAETGAAVLLLAAFEQSLAVGEFQRAAELAAQGASLGSVNTLWVLRRAEAVELTGDEGLAAALRAEAFDSATASVARRDSCLNRVNWLEALAAFDQERAGLEIEAVRGRCSDEQTLRQRLLSLEELL